MKRTAISLIMLVLTSICFAQVGIGTTNPKGALDITSTKSGLVLPRVSNTGAVTNPSEATLAVGTMVYDLSEGCVKVVIATGWSNCLSYAPLCGANVAAGVYKAFMCHNLGADTGLDPNVPVQGIHGNYYQWGRRTVVADAYTSSGSIACWNTTPAVNGSWLDASKTANDPCPTGFRVTTRTQWLGVIANNTVSRTGSWASDGNFTTAIHWGPNVSTKTLTLPATGYRIYTDGTLGYPGDGGSYWSSTENGASAYISSFSSINAYTASSSRTNGYPVRCVSE